MIPYFPLRPSLIFRQLEILAWPQRTMGDDGSLTQRSQIPAKVFHNAAEEQNHKEIMVDRQLFYYSPEMNAESCHLSKSVGQCLCSDM